MAKTRRTDAQHLWKGREQEAHGEQHNNDTQSEEEQNEGAKQKKPRRKN